MRYRLIGLPLIALSLLVAIAIPASSAMAARPRQAPPRSGGIGVGLIGLPGGPTDGPLGRIYVVDRLAPGKSLRRRVEIMNTTTMTADVAVYVAAAGIAHDGFAFAAGQTQNELSRWTSVSHNWVRLAPGASASDTLTIDVPDKASPGERYAVLWAQVSTVSSAEGGVRLVNRTGVRLYISVGPTGTPLPNFAIGSLTARRGGTGQPLVVAEVHNTGRTTLDISGNLTLSKGPGNLAAGPLPAKLGRLLVPGGSEPVTVRLSPGFPRGPWMADLRLTSGLLERSVVATITFPRVASATTVPGSSAFIFVAIALAGLLIALAFLVSRHGAQRRT